MTEQVTVYQDFDENCRAMWGKWFGYRSVAGHVTEQTGPHETAEEAEAALAQ